MKRKNQTLISIVFFLISQVAHAATTYTPAQLKKMVNNGKYPKQGNPTTQTMNVPFEGCNLKVKQIISDIGENYPAQQIADSNIIKSTKIWTNDGVLVLTCSKPDEKLIMTISKYL